MKKFIKRNIVVILILLIFSVIFLNADYEVMQEHKQTKEYRDTLVERCKEGNITDNEEKKFCESILNSKEIEVDFYTIFSEVLVWKVQYVYYLAFFIVVIPPMIQICKILKHKHIINSNSRESYKMFLKKFFMTAYKYIWILPLLCLILMIPLLMNFTLYPGYVEAYQTGLWSSNIIYHSVWFIILYLVYMVLVSILFVNISLLVARKQQKFIPCMILSYIFYFAIEIFFETVVRVIIIQRVFHSEFGMLFNILNIFTFQDLYGVGALLLLNLSFVLVSFAFVYLAYRNKEKLVMQCEKNK